MAILDILMSLTTLVKKAIMPLLFAASLTPLEAEHDTYATHILRSRRTENPQGILHGPHVQNGEAKINGPKPLLGGGGFIEIGFSQPIYNSWGVDVEVNNTNGGVYNVYALAPEGYWVLLGRDSGRRYFDLGYLPFTTAIRIENITLLKNIKVDWVRNMHPEPMYSPEEVEE